MTRIADTHSRRMSGELFLNGYQKFRIERHDSHGTRTADIYSDKPLADGIPTGDFLRADVGLFGESGSFRIYDPSGRMIVP